MVEYYSDMSIENCRELAAGGGNYSVVRDMGSDRLAREQSQSQITRRINTEAAMAGAVVRLVDTGRIDELNRIFYTGLNRDAEAEFLEALKDAEQSAVDPYLTFDPKKDVKDVTLSPVGIVHLFRQYFFELDTFLGTPMSHVWLSPGSTVELVEVSTRKTTVERTVESLSSRFRRPKRARPNRMNSARR